MVHERNPRELGPKHWIIGQTPFSGPHWGASAFREENIGGRLRRAFLLVVAVLCVLALALNFGWFRLIF